jgi:TNF receptor-associated protein 1
MRIRLLSETVEGKVEEATPVVEEPKLKGAKTAHTFQAETRELLNIVSKSLYTEKEVFIRELLSNASDALEKARFMKVAGEELAQPEKPLEINIFTDKSENTITIQDYGLGMNEDELIENIGTIARSGSKAFVKAMNDTNQGKMESIIGQFGVGFYSTFMVSDKVEVYSQSCKGGEANYWVSDGTGTFEMCNADNVDRGTKIVVHLKNDCLEFADKFRVETIVKKYSSYLQFPINLNGSVLTSTGALWCKTPREVSEDEHKEFYQLIANTYDAPNYVFHSHFENVKYSIQCLLYVTNKSHQAFGRLF